MEWDRQYTNILGSESGNTPELAETYVNNTMIPDLKDLVTRYHPDVLCEPCPLSRRVSDYQRDLTCAQILTASGRILPTTGRQSHFSRGSSTRALSRTPSRSTTAGVTTAAESMEGSMSASTAARCQGPASAPTRRIRGLRTKGWARASATTGSTSTSALPSPLPLLRSGPAPQTLCWCRDPPYFVGLLVQSVAFGGHLQLNVGPTADGRVPHPQVDILQAMGRWLDVNGEAIWNTTGYPFGITHGCTDSPAAAVVGESAPAPYTVVAAAKSAAQPPIHAMVGVSVADACVARLPSRVGMSSRIRAQ